MFERSDGNAFLVEELPSVVMAGGAPTELPASLRDVLLDPGGRFGTADPAAAAYDGGRRQVGARTFAAGGRRGLDEPTAFSALREAVENHLLVVDEAGRGYAFRHALARDAVYEDMLPGERGGLHHLYGEVISARPEIAGDDRGARSG